MRARRALAAGLVAAACACAAGHALAQADPPAPPRIPFKQGEDEWTGLLVRTIAALAVVAVAGAVAILWLRRRGTGAGFAPGGEGRLRVVETLRLGTRAAIVVVHDGRQRLLLGQTEQGLTLLAREPLGGDGP